ncbi:hypothetical protein F4677DRAFT_435945 [Hypoxylon crocopeplum]|nr:hypothetical protein F4677DRAFT_435945 [Hypoxylon crocopeplum]
MPKASLTTTRGNDLPERPKQRHRRTRTGCERCRAQRRKCDEEKPQCRRCITANASCKYVAHVSFLEKNSQTLSDNAASRLPSTSATPKYPVLEFISEFSTQEEVSGISSVTDYTRQPEEQRISLETVLESRPVPRRSSQLQVPENESHPFQWKDVQDYQNISSHSTQSPNSSERGKNWPLVGRSSLSDDEVDLLKYYGHHLAPWLDVYDQRQTFRYLVTQLAMNSPCVLEGILQLSAAFSGRPMEVVRRRGIGPLHLQAMACPPTAESPFSAIRIIASFVLVRTLLFVQDVPNSWKPSFYASPGFHKFSFTDATQGRIWFSLLALISRLEVAHSLMNHSASALMSEIIEQILTLSKAYESGVDQSQKTLDVSLRCLGLLADVINLCLPTLEAEDDVVQPLAAVSILVGAARVARWEELLEKLCAWHTSRPPELQPLMEVEGREATFPTVIFASGAGISSNIIYHTAVFLLLNNRPHSISLVEWHGKSKLDAAQMSPHWHARRVCGIALHSDPEHTKCWDPCMIAAFSLVARRMTHPSQQNEIIACLGRVKAAGWRIDGLIQRLRDEWGPVG